jgi:L-ascorbate metabolism protein UlaG (beta-lactamase superfamily)
MQVSTCQKNGKVTTRIFQLGKGVGIYMAGDTGYVLPSGEGCRYIYIWRGIQATYFPQGKGVDIYMAGDTGYIALQG